ncbi:hypothetical protein [Streptomyces sp. NPDC020141]|uniref:hypothetical protein n=1 Tax=Streptomyces sp. NPDC020141 TaxID=3365065 RepID=UPI0037B0A3C8
MSETTAAEAQELEATHGYGVAELAGVTIRIKAGDQWRPSYLRALRAGDYDTWAAGALHEDDVETFIELDATFEEINAFTDAAMRSVGDNPGKSGAPTGSRRSTRKR